MAKDPVMQQSYSYNILFKANLNVAELEPVPFQFTLLSLETGTL